MKKLLVLFLVVVIGNFCVVKSFDISLWLNGFNYPKILHSGINDNEKEYRIVRDDDSENLKLCYLEKGILGVWKLQSSPKMISEKNRVISLGWYITNEIQRFAVEEDPKFEYEIHAVYCGDNAIKKIEGIEKEFPSNVAVSVSQSGSSYSIHLMTFSDDVSKFNGINMQEILQENGYIG